MVAFRVASALCLLLLPATALAQEERPQPPTEPGKDIRIEDHIDESLKGGNPGAPAPARQEMEPASEPPGKEDASDPDEKKFTLSGYIEGFYQYNFNNPGNGISNYRGYDTRHNSFTLSNAVLDAGFRAKNLMGRIALQIGHTPATYYAQEPSLNGTDGAGSTDPTLWRFLQRATFGWAPRKAILLEAGLFLANTGVESLAVKDNWNWSRSNTSIRLPNYMTGVKATWHATDGLDVSAMVANGWNTIVDDNDEKSMVLQAQYRWKETFSGSLTYIGGVEREGGAPEGPAWRHAFDLYFQAKPVSFFEIAAEGSSGWEANRFGLHWFAGTAVFARLKMLDWLYFAARGDRLWEDPSANALGAARPFMVPAKDVTSTTATLDARPLQGLSLRVELRHDVASEALFFRSHVEGDGSSEQPYRPNARSQVSLLGGAVAWF